MEDRILSAAREQLVTVGAAALSLREIARSLGVVSSAVYRYVNSRDELLTRLLIDAYDDLACDVDAAVDSAGSSREALGALARALRSWARAQPERWALIYGSPVPGYAAPSERTNPPATRVIARLVQIAAAGDARRSAPTGAYAHFLAEGLRDLGVECSVVQGSAAVEAWSSIVGAVSGEVFGQLGVVDDEVGASILDDVVAGQAERMGLV